MSTLDTMSTRRPSASISRRTPHHELDEHGDAGKPHAPSRKAVFEEDAGDHQRIDARELLRCHQHHAHKGRRRKRGTLYSLVMTAVQLLAWPSAATASRMSCSCTGTSLGSLLISSNTCSASASRPCWTSQRGDSGRKYWPKSCSRPKTTEMAMGVRQ